jgi:hypothetical protein
VAAGPIPPIRPIFIAHGPAFRSGVVLPEFDNVEVYHVLAWLLGVKAKKVDGTPEHVKQGLAN